MPVTSVCSSSQLFQAEIVVIMCIAEKFGHLLKTVHCTTQTEARRCFDVGFSSCAVPDYLLLMSEYFKCIPEVLRITGSVWELSGSLEVNLELSIVQRGEHRG